MKIQRWEEREDGGGEEAWRKPEGAGEGKRLMMQEKEKVQEKESLKVQEKRDDSEVGHA